MSLGNTLTESRRQAIVDALVDCGWNVKQAAVEMNVCRRTLQIWMQKFDIRNPNRPVRTPKPEPLSDAELLERAGKGQRCRSMHRWANVAPGQWVCERCPEHRTCWSVVRTRPAR